MKSESKIYKAYNYKVIFIKFPGEIIITDTFMSLNPVGSNVPKSVKHCVLFLIDQYPKLKV